MLVNELMERIGIKDTGRVGAYLEEALLDLNMNHETHIKLQKLDITKDQRFYYLPNDMVKILEVRALNHLNSKDEYRRIPRLLNKPWVPDSDNV
tara:strand:- start:376 stop:657 length:282 start_codon:yes stop_codon:yes gene_type:complete